VRVGYSCNARRGIVPEDFGPASSIGYSGAIRCDRDVAWVVFGTRGNDETSARDVARRIQIRVVSDLDHYNLSNLGRLSNTVLVGVSFDGLLATGSG
jgi:hypothetical protein